MKRRQFLRSGALASTAAATNSALGKGEVRPNIVIIHCDELNFRTIGCYRETLSDEQAFMWGTKKGAVCETPHIDSIAKEGALCTKSYASTPVCSPSRSTLMTGRYSHQTPVVNNNVPLADEMVTFASILGDAGYATGYSGKWHLDGHDKPGWAPERKFGWQDNRYMINRGHWKQLEDGPDGPRVAARDNKGKPSYSIKGANEENFATDWLSRKTIEFIDEHAESDSPFCYMCSIPDPHGPDTVRAPYDSMYNDEDVEVPRTYGKDADAAPSWAKPAPKCSTKMAQYHGMMKCIDDNVGVILDHLRAKGLLDDTIFIFTADHGDMRGEHGRQNKGVPLEASAKIPLVVRYPARIPAGIRVDAANSTIDVLPTLLSLTGVPMPKGHEVSGRDISPLLTGSTPKDWEDVTFCRSTGKPGESYGWVGALTPRYKLLLCNQDEPWLLDLEQDPDELINFIREKPKAARKLAGMLKEYGEREKDPYLTNPETSAALEGLL